MRRIGQALTKPFEEDSHEKIVFSTRALYSYKEASTRRAPEDQIGFPEKGTFRKTKGLPMESPF